MTMTTAMTRTTMMTKTMMTTTMTMTTVAAVERGVAGAMKTTAVTAMVGCTNNNQL
jgi:hypothetical protein